MAEEHDGEEQLVVFELASESYAVDITAVHEIIRMQHITPVPRAPDFVEGVINLRGRVIPVVDLRKRFGLPVSDNVSKPSRIVVVDIQHHTIGIIVDGVTEVLRIPRSTIEPPSPIVANVDSAFLRGIAKLDDRLIILLDLEELLTAGERKAIGSVSGNMAA